MNDLLYVLLIPFFVLTSIFCYFLNKKNDAYDISLETSTLNKIRDDYLFLISTLLAIGFYFLVLNFTKAGTTGNSHIDNIFMKLNMCDWGLWYFRGVLSSSVLIFFLIINSYLIIRARAYFTRRILNQYHDKIGYYISKDSSQIYDLDDINNKILIKEGDLYLTDHESDLPFTFTLSWFSWLGFCWYSFAVYRLFSQSFIKGRFNENIKELDLLLEKGARREDLRKFFIYTFFSQSILKHRYLKIP